MKKILFGLLFLASYAKSQNGLECVRVEKYYISNAADAAQADVESTDAGYPTGALPAGSVTYRIYVDMLPGYKLWSVYADKTRMQSIEIKTTTSFYNNPSGGLVEGSSKTAIKNNLLSLDSWFTLGAAANGNNGVPKADDNGANNNVTVAGNTAGILLNSDPAAGIPLTTQDGMIVGTGMQTPALSGIDTIGDILNDGSKVGNSFVLEDGSWGNPAGAIGANPDSNKVLIAQITTDGVFSFKLNVFVQDPSGNAEFYVAENPGPADPNISHPADIQLSCLTYTSTITGINTKNPSASNAFTISPNPVYDLLTVEVNSFEHNQNQNNDSYTIYSLTGNVMLHKTIGTISDKHLENIDVSSLAKGMYFIQLSIDGVTSTKKIIKN